MAVPDSSDLKEALTYQDWSWTPTFKNTPLRLSEIEKVISRYYSAVDEHIEKLERGSPEDVLSTTQQSWDNWKQKAHHALMTYTHAGIRQPLGVRHRAILEKCSLAWLFGKSSSLYYFALAWQFNEWREHVMQAYYDKRDEIEPFTEGDEEDFHRNEELLDAWLDLQGIHLDAPGKSDVVGYAFNRYQRDKTLRKGLIAILVVVLIVACFLALELSGVCDRPPGAERIR